MTVVKIDTPGVSVEVHSDEALSEVSRKALKLFRQAGGWPQDGHGPATGFAAAERRWTPDRQPSSIWEAPTTTGRVGFGEVTA